MISSPTASVPIALVPAVLLAACLLPSAASAQQASVAGRVRAEDGVPVADATVRLRLAADSSVRRLTGTDRLGFFVFQRVTPGEYLLTVARIGFGPRTESVSVSAARDARLDIVLSTQAVELEGLVVETRRSRRREWFEESAGVTVEELNRAEIKSIPGIAEADPMRAVEVLPGVVTVSDFSSAFNVRGGSADQNLILLDGVPIINPFHLAGFFSVFNADMVERAELRSGGFPAEYGGRVSSVLTIETDLGDGEFGVDSGLSLLATRVAAGDDLPDGTKAALGFSSARWRASGRRSYFDLLLPDLPYYLMDFQGAFEAWTRGGHRLKLTAYSGRDVLNPPASDDFAGMNSRWGNDAVGASWTRPMSGGGAFDLRASFSRFHMDFDFFDQSDTDIANGVSESLFGVDLERRPTPRIRWKSGLSAKRATSDNLSEIGGAVLQDQHFGGWELGAYTQMRWNPSSRWLIEGGVRVDYWAPSESQERVAGESSNVVTVSPRGAVKRFVGNGNWAVRVAGGRFTQFLHSRRDERLPFGIDVWLLAERGITHVVSDQVQMGVEGYFGPDEEWSVSAEGYYRSFDGVIAQNNTEDPADPMDDVVSGDGSSYGADLMVRKSEGETTGWVSISFLKAIRRFPDTYSNLTPTPIVEHPPVFDRRVEVDLVLRRPMGWGLVGGLRWNFGTGLPYTLQLASFRHFDNRVADLLVEKGCCQKGILLGPLNGERYPARHRLDISLRKPMDRSWGRVVPYLSVINLYNRDNILFYVFDYSQAEVGRRGISMIPFLPTAGVEVTF